MSDLHRRVRFRGFELSDTPSGVCTARVVLGWDDDETEFVGDSTGVDSPTGVLRCAAEAAIEALEFVLGKGVSVELLGVKSIRAFDSVVVVVSLASKADGGPQRLVGSCIIQDDPARGAALAVLNATNRLVGNVIHSR